MQMLALAVDGLEASPQALSELGSFCQRGGISRLVPGRSLQPPSEGALREALPAIRYPAVRNVFAPVGDPESAHSPLTAADGGVRQRAAQLVAASSQSAKGLEAEWVIIEWGPLPKMPDFRGSEDSESVDPESDPVAFLRTAEKLQDRVLDQICRTLHDVTRITPGIRLAVLPPRAAPDLPTPSMLEHLLEDLGPRRVAYWHDPGRARALQAAGLWKEETWLDQFGSVCVGVDLTDCIDRMAGLPAGCGEVDFRVLREGLGSEAIPVVRADPMTDWAPLDTAVQFLRGLGY